jgi:ABC-2 type transport system permease protein
MKDIITLLKPRIRSIINSSISKNGKTGFYKLILLGTIGVGFWCGVFAVSYRVLLYFKGIEEIGDILAFKLLSMIIITSFALLIFSGILTSLSKLYLSKDLFLVHSMPVSSYKIFIARWIDSTIDSSWMVIIYTLPVFISYGIIFHAGLFYYADIILAITALSLIASGISTILVMIAVVTIPANRMKSIFILFGLLLFMVLYITFRLLKPELLVDPEVFDTVLVYISALKTPSSPLLPSTWVFDNIKSILSGSFSEGLFHLALSWSFLATIIFTMVIISDLLYFKGFSNTQTAGVRLFKYRSSENRLFNFLPTPLKALALKEIKTFLRDQTQWSQLFLIGALIIIYIYNFSVLPIEKSPIKTVYLQNLLAFLNMGLALFVLTAITARFAYPAVSTECQAFWILKSSPVRLKSFLWIKFFIYYFPLLILTEVLIVVTNILLHVTPFMMMLSTITVFFLVPGIVSMGIGLGAAYPDFKAENPTQTVTSFGGFLFMTLCAAYIALIIMIQAGPVYNLFMSEINEKALSLFEWTWIIISFTLAFIFSILVIIIPMRFGEARLSKILI